MRLWRLSASGKGKDTKPRSSVAVLKRLHDFFTEGSTWAASPVKTVMPSFQRIVTLSISDANKKHMIEFEPLVDILLECLLLDESNRRHGQEGRDALQEASAGVIQELSLYGPGCAASISWGGDQLAASCDGGRYEGIEGAWGGCAV